MTNHFGQLFPTGKKWHLLQVIGGLSSLFFILRSSFFLSFFALECGEPQGEFQEKKEHWNDEVWPAVYLHTRRILILVDRWEKKGAKRFKNMELIKIKHRLSFCILLHLLCFLTNVQSLPNPQQSSDVPHNLRKLSQAKIYFSPIISYYCVKFEHLWPMAKFKVIAIVYGQNIVSFYWSC